MIFRRSASGLANLHLFFKVDVIVYCEGGSSLSLGDILAKGGNEDTLDVSFWQRVAEFLGAKRRYHFKSVGSKPTLLSVASDVRANQLTSVIVCFDRDFDWHCGRKEDGAFVAYTHGYSWENDVISAAALENVFFTLLPPRAETRGILEKGLKRLAAFEAEMAQWCETEISLAHRRAGAVFPRNKPLALVKLNTVDLPHLDFAKVRASLNALGYQRRPKCKVRIQPNEALRHSWGKLVAAYCYHLLVRLVAQKQDGIKFSYDLFMRWMTAETFRLIVAGKNADAASHYRSLGTVFA
jgi:hypothetical protein